MSCRPFTAFLLLALLGTPSAAEDVVPLDHFSVAPDFEFALWARSPMLRNPTNIDIDAQGRVWVAEGANYRDHDKRDRKGDRIVILEDTDGDGSADKSSVFVQDPRLASPLGIAVIDNQVVVSNAPDLIVYTDVNRDLKFDPAIDTREVLLTGFEGQNSDHGLHSVTAGPDGRWYFNSGNAGANFTDRSRRTFRASSPWSAYVGASSDDGHVYLGGFAARMQPDGTDVEIIGHNFRNSYEQAITSFGDVFQNDNDDSSACRTTWMMEYGNFGYSSRDGSRSWRADRRPGQSIPTAHWRQDDPGVVPAGDVYGSGAPTGIVFNEGDALGAKWRGLLLSAEAGRNTIFGYLPKPQGASFSLERFPFFTSNKEQQLAGLDFGVLETQDVRTYFRPSDVAIGTDGAIYIADWFDPRVGGHMDLDDSMSGAIYRIVPKGSNLKAPRIDLETLEGQVAALKSPAVNVRNVGFTRIAARGAPALPSVAVLLRDENPFVRARAIWLLSNLGSQGIELVERELKSADPQQRIVALRALRRAHHDVLEHLQTLVYNTSPAVRRDVALALRDVPFDAARDLLLILAQGYDGKDRSYLEAWGIGATGKTDEVYAALATQTQAHDPVKWPAAYADLVWRLTPTSAAKAFAARAKSSRLSSSDRTAAITALGFTPTRDAAEALLDIAQGTGGTIKENPALWWLLNYKDSRWKDMDIDAGLRQRGLYAADRVQISEVIVPEAAAASGLPPVAEIAKLQGDAFKGKEKAGACLLCHRIAKQGVDYAPSLDGWAARQAKEATITAIRDPSADIAHGYRGTEIVIKDGKKVQGIVLSSGDPITIQSTGGLIQMIPAAQVAAQNELSRSLMLSAEQLGFSAQDVADIVAYLRTAK